MEGRDRWFIADLDRDEMLALRTQSLAQLAKEYVRGVENPAWIQAATSLRCGIRNVCPRPARPLSTTRPSIHDAHTHTHTHTHTSRDAMEQWFQSGGVSQGESKRRLSLYLAAVLAAFLPCPEAWGIVISWLLRSPGR